MVKGAEAPQCLSAAEESLTPQSADPQSKVDVTEKKVIINACKMMAVYLTAACVHLTLVNGKIVSQFLMAESGSIVSQSELKLAITKAPQDKKMRPICNFNIYALLHVQ